MNVSSLATLAAAVTAFGVAIAACGGSTTNNNAVPHSSHLGESCLTTGDCMDPNVCVHNVCVAAGTGDGGTSSGATSSSGGSSGGASSSGSSSGGSSSGSAPEAAPPHLGARGDACTSTTDCGTGLSCIPLAGTAFVSGGICDLPNYSLSGAGTGKSCNGECNQASDCCQLPVNVVIGATTYHNCNDIQNQVIAGASCSSLTPGDTANVALGCFYFATYCNGCSAAAWTCASSHLCQYGGTCMASGLAYQGCPARTRASRALGASCNANACAPASVTTGCSTAADCAGQGYTAFSATYSTNAICRAPTGTGTSTDCTCYQHSCYLACTADLNCATGYKCDTGSSTCVPAGGCSSDAQCALQLSTSLAKCVSNTCQVACATDQDCGPSGVAGLTSFAGRVCVSGLCQFLSCSTDADCNATGATSNAVHMFCETQSTTATVYHYSAITN